MRKRKLLISVLCIVLLVSACLQSALALGKVEIGYDDSTGSIVIGDKDKEEMSPKESVKDMIGRYKKVAATVLALCTITSLVALVFSITRLGAAGDNERARANAFKGILFSCLSFVLFGGGATIIGIFWNALHG